MEAITRVYKTFSDGIYSALSRLPENRYYEVKFEDFEKDPMQSITMLYKHLGKEMSSLHKQAIMSFLEENRDFRKNHYTLTEDEVSLIEEKLKEELDRTGYENPH